MAQIVHGECANGGVGLLEAEHALLRQAFPTLRPWSPGRWVLVNDYIIDLPVRLTTSSTHGPETQATIAPSRALLQVGTVRPRPRLLPTPPSHLRGLYRLLAMLSHAPPLPTLPSRCPPRVPTMPSPRPPSLGTYLSPRTQ